MSSNQHSNRQIKKLVVATTLASFFGVTFAAVADETPESLPSSPREVVVDTYHGNRVEDPFRWLEGGILIEDADQAASLESRVGEWTDAQNAYTRAMLDNIEGRDALSARIGELMRIDSIGTPNTAGSRYFHRERRGDQNQAILYVRDSLNGEPRVLLDPNTLDDDGLISLDWYEPSHDGAMLAFGLSRAGDENSTLYVMNVESGEWLAEEIPNRASSVGWMPDGRSFFYDSLADPDDPYSSRIRHHVVGTHHRQDPILFEQFSTTWGPFGYPSRDGRWLVLGYWTSTDSNDLWFVDIDEWKRTGRFEKTELVKGAKGNSWGPVHGDTLYLHTTVDAPNGMVYAIDLTHPAKKHWKTVIPERPNMVLDGVSTARGMLVAEYTHKATTRIERFALNGQSLGEVTLPGIGSASISTNDDRTEAFYSFSSFNVPSSIYRVDLASNTSDLWARPDVPVDPDLVDVSQVTYSSKDGTPVTMFVVHKKGLQLDGNNPTLLSGYGGFNISMTPYFSRTLFPWLEAGGVYAMPNLRGGGEYGEAWHRAGMLEQKQNVFDDFIAAGEWLIDNGYTNSSRLGISGGSNGGLLVGAVAVQRPDLFRAVVCDVPLLDMLRYQHFLMARYWVPEYGSSDDATQYAFLKAYSPYHNITNDVEYPAMLIRAGENDSRVHPAHARKMAAALQHATSSDQMDKPILLWVDRDAGHGGGKPLKNQIRDIVDQRIFLMWQLGMTD